MLHRAEVFKISSCTKRLVTDTCDDHDPGVVVDRQLIEEIAPLLVGRRVDGIAHLGPVDRDFGHMVAGPLKDEVLEVHQFTPVMDLALPVRSFATGVVAISVQNGWGRSIVWCGQRNCRLTPKAR